VQLIAVLTPEGGHVSWALPESPTGHSWENAVVVQFFTALLQLGKGGRHATGATQAAALSPATVVGGAAAEPAV
jgi:hypothetical protein